MLNLMNVICVIEDINMRRVCPIINVGLTNHKCHLRNKATQSVILSQVALCHLTFCMFDFKIKNNPFIGIHHSFSLERLSNQPDISES